MSANVTAATIAAIKCGVLHSCNAPMRIATPASRPLGGGYLLLGGTRPTKDRKAGLRELASSRKDGYRDGTVGAADILLPPRGRPVDARTV